MIDPAKFVQCLLDNDVSYFTGVPDSLLKHFCAYVEHKAAHQIAANEGGAIAIAAGHHLAWGRMTCVYMQNSGLGNAVNPLVSLADPDVYSIPMLLVIGWRGEPGTKDEPQHVKQGKITLPMLEVMDIPYKILPQEQAEAEVAAAELIAIAKREKRPVALVVRKDTFSPYKGGSKPANLSRKKREKTIEFILKHLHPVNTIVVSTTGMISREVYEIRERSGYPDHSRDFLTVGSMGHSLMIAMSIARQRPKKTVVCLDGDGSVLMHMGGLAIAGACAPKNLVHIVLNNAAHDSVGGQPTVAGYTDLPAVAHACGYEVAEFDEKTFFDIVHDKGRVDALFMEVQVAKGARKDLGRPKESPQENKELFMNKIKPRFLV